jgi:carboxymethylenebutenolidase
MNTRIGLVLRGCLTAAVAAWLGGCQSADSPPATPAAAPTAAPAPTTPAPTLAAAPSSVTGPAEAPPPIPVLEQDVAYGEGQKNNLIGFLAMPRDAAEPLPGVLVIHEWWGLNDDIKAITRRLAGEGYVALAVDLYGGATATTPDQAQQLMTTVLEDPMRAQRNLSQAYDYLEKYALAPRIGSIGWDLGGGWSLQAALLFPDSLDAMVMYYGQVVNDRNQLAKLRMPLLGFFGSEDKSIPVRDVQAFRSTLSDLSKNAEILIMVGDDHAFANPTSRTYDERAATEAWSKTLQFLARNLKTPQAAQ